MSREKICGIYKIENLVNGKVYIGQSVDIYKRWTEHKDCITSKKGYKPLYRAFRKYGVDNFNFEIIEKCSKEELNEKEIYYIEQYRAYIHWEDSNGYNLTLGGEGSRGRIVTEEESKLMSERMKELYSKGLYINPNSIKVYCEGKTFNSVTECADYYGINDYTMRDWIRGSVPMPKEWYDKGLRREDKKMSDYKTQIRSKRVICEGKTFESITECANYYNTTSKNIGDWLYKKINMPKKFYDMKLHFEEDNFEECDYKPQSKYNHNSKIVICENIEYPNVNLCAERYGIKPSTMKCWLNHSNKMPIPFYNLGLHYKDEPMENYEVVVRKMVICENVIYNNVTKCANHYNIKPSTMHGWLSGKNSMPQEFRDKGLKYYEQ